MPSNEKIEKASTGYNNKNKRLINYDFIAGANFVIKWLKSKYESK
jgi:hypothetical protein